jgi:hypothetical protein
MLSSIINGNAATSVEDRARSEHASAERNIYPGEHYTTKRIVLYIVV